MGVPQGLFFGNHNNACISGFPRGATPGVPPGTEGAFVEIVRQFYPRGGRDRLAFDHLWITPAGRPRGFVWSAVESTEECCP